MTLNCPARAAAPHQKYIRGCLRHWTRKA